MPLTFAVATEVVPARKAVKVVNVGHQVLQPLQGEPTLTGYFVSLDAAGNQVDAKPLTINLAVLKAKYPTEFATVYEIMKRILYKEAQESGLYPVGVVT